MIKSISFGVMPALSIAIVAASTPMVVVVSFFLSAYLLSFIPVLSCIHSSLVSMYFSKSLLVNTFLGTYIPMPAILVLGITSNFKESYQMWGIWERLIVNRL